MTLYTNCQSCKTTVILKIDVETRGELEIGKGEEFTINCQNCGVFEKKHVNQIKARSNRLTLLLSFIIGLIVSFFLWKHGVIAIFSTMIPLLFWKEEMKSVKIFNSYLL